LPRFFFIGLSTAENLLVNLTRSLQRHTPLLARLRAERESHEATRALREAQDNAYYASLRADQEKDRRTRKAEEAKRIAEEKKRIETERKEREYKEKKEKREQWRRWAVESLPEEPGDGDKGVTRLSFKFPDGKRVVRRFRDSESLEVCVRILQFEGELLNLLGRREGEAIRDKLLIVKGIILVYHPIITKSPFLIRSFPSDNIHICRHVRPSTLFLTI